MLIFLLKDKNDPGITSLLYLKSLRNTQSLLSVPTQLEVPLVGTAKQLKKILRGFRSNVLPQLEEPTRMTCISGSAQRIYYYYYYYYYYYFELCSMIVHVK